ncbi:hypothetical protein CY35_04G010900 [Sphagnum magellanicum]|nr:hypothetical protein CY35_04G010900 [Sphagnum magellanicum]
MYGLWAGQCWQNLYLRKHHPLRGLLTHNSKYIVSPYCHHCFLYQIIGADDCARIFSLVLVSDRSRLWVWWTLQMRLPPARKGFALLWTHRSMSKARFHHCQNDQSVTTFTICAAKDQRSKEQKQGRTSEKLRKDDASHEEYPLSYLLMCVCRNAATSDFRPDVGGVDMQINIACPSNMIMVALGGKF